MALALAGVLVNGCGLSNKASEAQKSLAVLQAEYEAFDLTCSFDDISGNSEAETAATDGAVVLHDGTHTETSTATESATTSSTCENAEEQYSVLVDEFDADGDGTLSEDEMAEAEAGWADAQKAELDADGDGTITEEEKAAFRESKLATRKAKLDARFEEGCKAAGKEPDECRHRRGHRRDHLKEQIEARMSQFDKDGDGKLSQAEAQALKETMKQEREQRKESFGKQHDKDGDGKLGPAERQERRDDRNKDKPAGMVGGKPSTGTSTHTGTGGPKAGGAGSPGGAGGPSGP
jgi:Ca2+-binding EF-hand superfamily protein